MNNTEFQRLRNLPNKHIDGDINFTTNRNVEPNYFFEHVKVNNSAGYEVLLNGTFRPEIPSITFNFVIKGLGPICRLDLNGTIHKNVGRHHKHELVDDNDTRNNLPFAIQRADLCGNSASDIWRVLCAQACITHNGSFIDPAPGQVIP